MKTTNLEEKVNNLPQVPGSYIFKDKLGNVIYVGKAKNLRARVKSYFSVIHTENFKTAELVKRINDLDFIKVASEFEAIILEAELIKKYKPKYNIVLKDDRSKIYIIVRDEKINVSGKNINLPKVITARKPEIILSDRVFGPYPNNTVVKNILSTLRKIFVFRDCSYLKFSKYKKIGSPCLYGHIGICSAPCINNKDEDISSYKKNISRLGKILSGGTSGFVSGLERKMNYYSSKEKFEEAASCRDLLEKFSYVQKSFIAPEEYMDNPSLMDDIHRRSLEEIMSFVPTLDHPPKRIECYDISNISGKEAVGSMVVAVEGRVEKGQYRRFKIRFKEKPDDFGMIYEVLYRRFSRESVSDTRVKWGIPDLVIVDGGKPQVSAALRVVQELDMKTPVVGLAKRNESIVYKVGEEFVETVFSRDSYGMRLVINLRDQAHRFAQSYHHMLRKRTISM